MIRECWERFWDYFTRYKVYFFAGWQYASIIPVFIGIITMLIVSDFNQYLPAQLRFSSLFYAALIMVVIVIGTTAFGSVAFYKAGMRENDMNLRNSRELMKLLGEMNERLKRLEDRE